MDETQNIDLQEVVREGLPLARQGADGGLRWTPEWKAKIDAVAAGYHVEVGDRTEYLPALEDQALLVPGSGDTTLQQWAAEQVQKGLVVLLGLGIPPENIVHHPEGSMLPVVFHFENVLLAVKGKRAAELSHLYKDQPFPIYAEQSWIAKMASPGAPELVLFIALAALAGLGLRRLVA